MSTSFQRVLSSRLGQVLKLPARSFIARAGYEIQPVTPTLAARVTSLLRRSPVDHLLDVGANQGQYASSMREMGFEGHILSFEPGKSAFHLLDRRSASDPNWDCQRLALGSSSQEMRLRVARNSVSSSLLAVAPAHLAAAPESATDHSDVVEVRRLDRQVATLQGKFWLKVDTQGFEMEVIHGAEGILPRVNIVQLELSVVALYEGQANWLELLQGIIDRGFTVVDLLPGFRDKRGDMLQCDVLALRQ